MNFTMRTNNILAVADWLQVFRPDTVARVAKVIEGHAFGNWPNELSVGPTVGTHSFTIKPKGPISANQGTFVHPAIAQSLIGWGKSIFADLAPKSVCRSLRHIMKWVSVTILRSVVFRAEPQFENWAVTEAAKRPFRIIRSAPASTYRIAVALPAGIMGDAPSSTMRRFLTFLNGACCPFGITLDCPQSFHSCGSYRANAPVHYTTLAKEV